MHHWFNVKQSDVSTAGVDSLPWASWEDCAIVIALENDMHACQWTIASTAGHPALKETIELITARAQQGIDVTDPHIFHGVTGPAIWTKAIRNVLHIDESVNARGMFTAVRNTSSAAHQRAKELGVCLMGERFFHGINAENLFGSQRWADDPNYVSWTKEREENETAVKSVA